MFVPQSSHAVHTARSVQHAAAEGRGQCVVTSERSWVRGDRDTSCCLCKSGARSRSRVFPLPRILSKLPPEPPEPSPSHPPDPRTLSPSRSARVRWDFTAFHAREGPAGRALALALVLITLRTSHATFIDISALSSSGVSFKPSNKRSKSS